MVAARTILEVLKTIPDPEMPISIVDLGLIENVRIEGRSVRVDVLPTFVGCPALPMIADDIREKLAALPDVDEVEVEFCFEPAWSVDRITDAGRASLKAHGVSVPTPGSCATTMVSLTTSAIPCPFCESTETRLDSPFGPTRCRMIYYCDACRNTFEHLKKV